LWALLLSRIQCTSCVVACEECACSGLRSRIVGVLQAHGRTADHSICGRRIVNETLFFNAARCRDNTFLKGNDDKKSEDFEYSMMHELEKLAFLADVLDCSHKFRLKTLRRWTSDVITRYMEKRYSVTQLGCRANRQPKDAPLSSAMVDVSKLGREETRSCFCPGAEVQNAMPASKEMHNLLQRLFRLGVKMDELHLSCTCFHAFCAALLADFERPQPQNQGSNQSRKNVGGPSASFDNRRKSDRGAGSIQAESIQRKLLSEKIQLLNAFVRNLLEAVT